MGKEHSLSEVLGVAGGKFLLADLDVALTFMDAAETTGIWESARRNHREARQAYASVLRLLDKFEINTVQRNEIDQKLKTLKARLVAAGQEL